jgi:hypothetical protein
MFTFQPKGRKQRWFSLVQRASGRLRGYKISLPIFCSDNMKNGHGKCRFLENRLTKTTNRNRFLSRMDGRNQIILFIIQKSCNNDLAQFRWLPSNLLLQSVKNQQPQENHLSSGLCIKLLGYLKD